MASSGQSEQKTFSNVQVALEFQAYGQLAGPVAYWQTIFVVSGILMSLGGLVFLASFILYWVNYSIIVWEEIFIFSFSAVLLVLFSIMYVSLYGYEPNRIPQEKYYNTPKKYINAANGNGFHIPFWIIMLMLFGYCASMCALTYVQVHEGFSSTRTEVFVGVCVLIGWTFQELVTGLILLIYQAKLAVFTIFINQESTFRYQAESGKQTRVWIGVK